MFELIPRIIIVPQFFKHLSTTILSILAVYLYLKKKTNTRKLLMIAMLLSTVGDFFMTDTFNLGDMSLYPGAGFFMISHLVYSYTIYKEIKNENLKVKNKGLLIGILIMVISTLALELEAFLVPAKPVTVMALLLLVYIAIIGINLCLQFSYGFSKKGLYYFLPIGMVIFYLTDLWIFVEMLEIFWGFQQFLWFFYPIAQAFILIFNDPIFEK